MPAPTVSEPSAKLVGRTEPRLFTPPLRPLTRETTRGFEIIDFAEMIGEPLLPWQQWLVKHALELLPDGRFRFRVVVVLVARQNGKSSLKRIVSLWRLYIDGARMILGVAQDVSLAREQWNMCLQTIHASPDLAAEFDKVRNVNGDEWFRLANGARYKIGASNRRAGRGLSVDELNIDELREQRDWDAWSALSKTTMARENGQTWAMSNAGDDESVVLNQLRDAALAERDESLFLAEWSGPDGCELDDWDAIAQANPALGYLIHQSSIDSARGTDPPNVYRTEVLCQKVELLDGAIDPIAWKACADPAGSMPKQGRIAGFDVAPDGLHATLSTAVLLPDGRVRVSVVKAWKTVEDARAGLTAALDALKPDVVVWYPAGPGAAFAPILRPKDLKTIDGRKVYQGREYIELTGLKVSEACQGLADLAKARTITHPDDPLLNAHAIGAQKLPSGDGWRFIRKGVGHCDAAYAAAGAAHIALTRPVTRPRIRSVTA